jgi:cytochrome c-type biogenesis protein CcmH
MFLILAGLCLVLALVFVLFPFIRASSEFSSQERNELNVTLHKEYLITLEQQLTDGDIDQAVFAQLKAEAEDKLLGDYNDDKSVYRGHAMPRWIGLTLGFFVIAVSIGLYQKMGAISDWYLAGQYQSLANQGEDFDPQEYNDFIDEVAAYADQSAYPKDWWFVAAQGYLATDNYPKAIDAFGRLQKLLPSDSTVMANLGQAMYLGNNRVMSEDARVWLTSALAISPTNTTALGVLGISAFEKADYQQAIDYWNKALAVLPPYSRQAQILTQGVDNAKRAITNNSGGVAESEAKSEPEDSNSRIEINLSLGSNVSYLPAQTIFLFARAVNGPRFPLAAVKLTASQLPMSISLDESDAMQPGVSISQFDDVVVTARLSLNSDPIASSGDWQSDVVILDLSQALEPVDLVINQPVP